MLHVNSDLRRPGTQSRADTHAQVVQSYYQERLCLVRSLQLIQLKGAC
jgi:hypothetical protein